MNARFEAAYARIPAITPTKQTAWLCWQARDQEIASLRGALTKLMQHFPTDDDMQAAGWNKSEINEACDAYEAAHAALSKALGLEGEQG